MARPTGERCNYTNMLNTNLVQCQWCLHMVEVEDTRNVGGKIICEFHNDEKYDTLETL